MRSNRKWLGRPLPCFNTRTICSLESTDATLPLSAEAILDFTSLIDLTLREQDRRVSQQLALFEPRSHHSIVDLAG
jgi:hypothetical protein